MTHTPRSFSSQEDLDSQFEQFEQVDDSSQAEHTHHVQHTASTPALSRRQLRAQRQAQRVSHATVAHTPLRQTSIFIVLLVIFSICGYFAYQAIVHHQTPIQAIEQRGPASTLTIATSQALPSLNIQTDNATALDQALLDNVYETLLRKDQNNNAGSGLAKSWSVSDDGLTYTFQLNHNMHFANGDPLNANDAVWSLQQIIEHQFVGNTALQHIEHVAAPDTNTLTIQLRTPDPELPWKLSGRAGIVYNRNAHIDYQTQALGSGPFLIKYGSFKPGKSLTLTYNPNYWGTKAQLGSVTLTPYSDSAQAVHDLQQGAIQAIVPVAGSAVDAAQALANDHANHITLTQGLGTGKLVLGFNSSPDSLFSDQALRVGARFAIDKKALAQSQHNAAPLYGPLTQLDPAYSDLSSAFPYDTAAARSKLSFFLLGAQRSLVYPDTIDEHIANTIADQLRAVGFNINVERVDTATWQDHISKNQFDLTLYNLPDSHDFGWYVSSQNPLHFTDSQSEDLYAKAMSATNSADYDKNLQLYAQRLTTVSPVDWLYQDQPWVAWSDNVSQMPTNMVDRYLPLAQVSVQ